MRNNFPQLNNGKQHYIINMLFNNKLVKFMTDFTVFLINAINQYLINEGISRTYSKLENTIMYFDAEEFSREFDYNKFYDMVLHVNRNIPSIFTLAFGDSKFNEQQFWFNLGKSYPVSRANQNHNSHKSDPLQGAIISESPSQDFDPFWNQSIISVYIKLLSGIMPVLSQNTTKSLIETTCSFLNSNPVFRLLFGFLCQKIDPLKYITTFLSYGSFSHQDYMNATRELSNRFSPVKKSMIVSRQGDTVFTINYEQAGFFKTAEARTELTSLYDFADHALKQTVGITSKRKNFKERQKQ